MKFTERILYAMSEEYFAPCPFCGYKGIKRHPCTSRVQCPKCYASGPLISRFKKDDMSWEDAAAEAWNTRAGDGGLYEEE